MRAEPLGEIMTGWVRRGSPGAAKLMTITKTDPWLVPTHKEAETAVSEMHNPRYSSMFTMLLNCG